MEDHPLKIISNVKAHSGKTCAKFVDPSMLPVVCEKKIEI
jgi:hypothetical protein